MIQKTADAIKNAMCACGCDQRPDCADPLPDGWVWDSGEPDSQWVFCPESSAHIPKEEPIASYQADAQPIPEAPTVPAPPKDVETWEIRRGATDCYFVDSRMRERIVAAKNRKDLEFIIYAIKNQAPRGQKGGS